jgi:pSer/pThr/pTyr-binding forkhead associated (FHA) protein
MATLVLSRADGSNENFPFSGEPLTIGRHEECGVLLHSHSASSHHAVLRFDADGNFYLKDLGSSNGTRLNGMLIEESVLNDADQISFGDEVAAFYLEEVELGSAAEVELPEPAVQVLDAPVAAAVRARSAPMPAVVSRPVQRRYAAQDEGGGCGGMLAVALLFLLAFFGGLCVKHYNKTGNFLLNDLLVRLKKSDAGGGEGK